MKLYDKLLKPIPEVNYLRAENVERYRVIIRYFFNQYEKINYWLYKEDIFDELSKHEIFKDYTIEKCQSDLNALCEWKNLVATQDTSSVTTLVDFKNRKFRYQITEYTVEIERMTLKLENLEIEGASLEPSLLERLQKQIQQFNEIISQDAATIHSWWQALNNDFVHLNQDYQDYIRTMNSAKADELMKTNEFLIFKDKLITYLRNFVKSLQMHGQIIEQFLSRITEEDKEYLFSKVVEYELSIPRLNQKIEAADIYELTKGRWISINKWFVGVNGKNEVQHMADITSEIIRKITRYAQQISELHNQGASRKEEYKLLADFFGKCTSLEEAHLLSSQVFGVERTNHLSGAITRKTDSITSKVYQEPAYFIALESRIRTKSEKSKRNGYVDYNFEKQAYRLELEAKNEQEKKLMEALIKDKKIEFSQLPMIDPSSRRILLDLLAKGLSNLSKKGKTNDGRNYYIDVSNSHMRCSVSCTDGKFSMPAYIICFED